MVCIAFILLTHTHPQGVVEQARRLAATGDHGVIHHDRNALDGDYRLIRHALADDPAVAFAPKRFRCGWGEWSLVAVTLSALGEAERRFPEATHVYLLSGDCMPVKFAEYTRAFLDRDSCDYVEPSISSKATGSRPASGPSGWCIAIGSMSAVTSACSMPAWRRGVAFLPASGC